MPDNFTVRDFDFMKNLPKLPISMSIILDRMKQPRNWTVQGDVPGTVVGVELRQFLGYRLPLPELTLKLADNSTCTLECQPTPEHLDHLPVFVNGAEDENARLQNPDVKFTAFRADVLFPYTKVDIGGPDKNVTFRCRIPFF